MFRTQSSKLENEVVLSSKSKPSSNWPCGLSPCIKVNAIDDIDCLSISFKCL
jgi:hypothetical protein